MTDEAKSESLYESAAEEPLAALAGGFGAVWSSFQPASGPRQEVLVVDRDRYRDLVAALRDEGFRTFIDLCAVDHLTGPARFEVVVHLLDTERRRRVRVKVPVPGDDPTVPSIVEIFVGAAFYEREAWDLFGVVFDGHPDLTRILLPDDWEGHPLRKDEPVGSVPVQFKAAPEAS